MDSTEQPVQTPWLNAKDAAAYLGRTSKYAYKVMLKLARQGRIKSGFDGKTFKFRPEDLDSWLYLNSKKISR